MVDQDAKIGKRLYVSTPSAALTQVKALNRKVCLPPNAKVEGPYKSAPWRRGRKISQRPRGQSIEASRPLPTFVRCHRAARLASARATTSGITPNTKTIP